MVRLEWSALVAEADGTLPGLVDAREHRRLFVRLLGDFERGLERRAEPAEETVDFILRDLAGGRAA